MKKPREIRRYEAVRKNRFGMLSWDPSRLFREAREYLFYAGQDHQRGIAMKAQHELIGCQEPWALKAVETLLDDAEKYQVRAALYHKYALAIAIERSRLSSAELVALAEQNDKFRWLTTEGSE